MMRRMKRRRARKILPVSVDVVSRCQKVLHYSFGRSFIGQVGTRRICALRVHLFCEIESHLLSTSFPLQLGIKWRRLHQPLNYTLLWLTLVAINWLLDGCCLMMKMLDMEAHKFVHSYPSLPQGRLNKLGEPSCVFAISHSSTPLPHDTPWYMLILIQFLWISLGRGPQDDSEWNLC